MTDRVLLLSYAFPPMAAPEATLSARAVRELCIEGIEVDVVGAWPARWQRSDASLLDYVGQATSDITRVHQPWWVPAIQPTRWTRRFPDALRFTNGRLVETVLERDLGRYQAVVTWSQWHSVHLAGLAVKRRWPHLRWVAHFSDLWSDNPLRPLRGLSGYLARRMERQVLAEADALTYTTGQARDLAVRAVSGAATKAHVLPHSFDEALYPNVENVNEGPLVVRYLGSFYGKRTPEHLFRGLAELVSHDPGGLDDVRFEIVGKVDRGMLDSTAARALPPGLVSARSSVDFLSSLRLMRSADLLLAVDAPAEENVFLASKLIDYVGARRPIVAITPAGMARDLVLALGGVVADPESPSGVAEAIAAGLSMARQARGADWGDEAGRAPYSLTSVSERRAAIVLGRIPRES